MKNKFKYGGGVLATLFLAILICFAACSNSSSSGENQDGQSGIVYSLGDLPDESKKTDKFSIEENSEGIYLTFDIPENTWQTRVYIEGLGSVAENVQFLDESKKKGCFFYPFVEAKKEYAIRFVFYKEEDKNKDGFVIDYIDGNGMVGWFQTNVTAGANSKGEVRFTSKGKIEVDKKDNFKFTQKPTFQNEHLLTENDNDWKVEIGLVEGISWDHGAERKTKWYGQVEI
ncbi:MAG: hypothetical protein K2N58_00165 [Treponemataceae bacterium]|nr:hypothetical protein [Treponemataceae bacterium]